MNNLLTRVYEMYYERCSQLPSESGINAASDNFAGIWQVGDLFEKQDKRLLFIGKTARGGYTLQQQECLLKTASQLWLESSWAFWSYTRDIVRAVYPNDDDSTRFEKIAISNLIKTNDWLPGRPTTDQTQPVVADYWITKSALFKEEISILRPTHVIIYAGRTYADAVSLSMSLTSNTDVSNKTILRVGEYSDAKIIITRHPERASRISFVTDVISAL